ncbi:DinB family protein [Sutcliffiella horikoshii]|uniref:DinB family protein n=1 Tax=Sutcliffiella horikoshii TaxID=79883 RepID=A0A5D4SYV1_9BACI|nr:DinB family protein [Sutcliffiella horikoshii]TYS67488.1 DinB family protein [Sutcliffiella horikoshii]
MTTKTILQITSLSGYEQEIGRALWCLEDVRRNLTKKIIGIRQSELDRKIESRHSIGSLLYHIAYVEAGWLFGEVMEKDAWDSEIEELFPLDGWPDGKLVHIDGDTIETHLHRLKKVRETLLSHFRSLSLEDWHRARVFEEYDVTPEWVIYHLTEHEAHHRGQIFQLLREIRNLEDK